MHRIASAGLVLGVLVAASSARAEPGVFGEQGSLIISGERLMPLFSYSRIRIYDGNDYATTSTSSISLLWSGAGTSSNFTGISDFYDMPHFGVDYAVAPHITVGGNLFFTLPISSKDSATQNGTTVTQDGDETSGLGLGARGGYVMPLTPLVSLWARGGLSYTRLKVTSVRNNGRTREDSIGQTGLDLEPLFVISPAPHFGFAVGPVLDIPVSGTIRRVETDQGQTTTTENDASQLHFGITVNMIGWL